MGTAAYMSPEQARGQKVDRRADIWSFGVVLYEMLTGKQTFTGDTVSDVLAAVLRSDIDLNALPGDVPPAIRQILRRCLARDRTQRLQAIGDARILIQESIDHPEAVVTDAGAPPVAGQPVQRSVIPWVVAGAAMLGLIVALFMRWPSEAPPRPIVRLNAEVSSGRLFSDLGSAVVLSPDGSRLVYVVGDGNNQQLHARSLDQLEGAPLSGTEEGYHPFFSPDGKWVGFVTPTELKKVSVSGGAPLKLCDVNLSRGASWGLDDTIVFAPTPGSGLSRVSAAGGEPQVLTELAEGESSHRWPQVLPGGEAVLFTSHVASNNFDDATIELLYVETGERKVLHRGGSYARYVTSGHLVYVREGTLFAAPFDLDPFRNAGISGACSRGCHLYSLPRERSVRRGGRWSAGLSWRELGSVAVLNGLGRP